MIRTARRSVLVVDDDDSIVTLISNQLVADGFVVTTASNGRDAIELIFTRAFDLIISDINMPVIDGLAVLLWTRKHKPKLPFVMISAHEPILTICGVPFVQKPIREEELFRAIKTTLG